MAASTQFATMLLPLFFFQFVTASTQFAATLLTLFFFQFVTGSSSATITINNECITTVWPVILSRGAPLSTTGFILPPGEVIAFTVPTAWSGCLWGRTLCSLDSAGKFSCVTGDCGSSTVECADSDAAPPATIAEFILSSTSGGFDLFNVSLVQGYNLPVMVEPLGATRAGNCSSTGCRVDLNAACPTELKVMNNGDVVACKSVCEAPGTCKPSFYSECLSGAYPGACVSGDYVVTFCPKRFKSSIMSGNGENQTAVNSSSKVIALIVSIISIFGLITYCKLRVYCKTKNIGMDVELGSSSS